MKIQENKNNLNEVFQIEELEQRLEMKLDWSVHTTPNGGGIQVEW